MSQSRLHPGPHPVRAFPGPYDSRLTLHRDQNDAQRANLSTGAENPRVSGATPSVLHCLRH